jgi:hypothetical protein
VNPKQNTKQPTEYQTEAKQTQYGFNVVVLNGSEKLRPSRQVSVRTTSDGNNEN